MTTPAIPATAASIRQLWVEFLSLFAGVPILMAVFFEEIQRNRFLFGSVWLLTGVAFALLSRTPGWRFRDLFRGPVLGEWRLILLYSIVTASLCLGFVFATDPGLFLRIVRHNPTLWLVIIVLYPLLSAWPQEVIYRALFFERYGRLFPSPTAAIIVNGAAFGFGHLFYDNWITISMTAAGGAVMGWAYLRHRSMALSWVLHAVAGQLIFTIGLGIYFYSGAVGATP